MALSSDFVNLLFADWLKYAKETASKSPTESGACAAIAIVDATALGILEVYVN